MSFLPELEQLNLACNNFSSDSVLVSPSQLFVALSTIPKLKRLDLSRNKFNQFHVEDLENFGTPASTNEEEPNGPFCFLEDLDFQFNFVQEEEGLIAPASALPSLMILNVTGNPFATKGDEFCLNLIQGM